MVVGNMYLTSLRYGLTIRVQLFNFVGHDDGSAGNRDVNTIGIQAEIHEDESHSIGEKRE